MATNPRAISRTGRSNTPNSVRLAQRSGIVISGVIDSTYAYDGKNADGKPYELSTGTVLAQITSSKKFVPLKRTILAAAALSAATTITVRESRHFKAGDTITVGARTGKVISSVNYTTDVITLTTALGADVADAAVVFASGDLAGAGTAMCICDMWLDLFNKDDQSVEDVYFGEGLFDALVDEDFVLGDLTAALAAGDLPHLFTKATLGL